MCSSWSENPLLIMSLASFCLVVSMRKSPLGSCWSTVRLSGPISAVRASWISLSVTVAGVLNTTDRPFRSGIIADEWALKLALHKSALSVGSLLSKVAV